MIRRRGKWLRWGEEDTVVMARILGPDTAKAGYTSRLDSVLLAASKKGVLLSPAMERRLDRALSLRGELRALRRANEAHLDGYPDDLLARFFAHQRVALAYFDRLDNGLMADQPGVGKTAPAIAWAEKRMESRALVVTPNSAKHQWARAIASWGDGNRSPASIVEGTIHEQNRIARDAQGWVVAHWEALVHAKAGLLAHPWSVVILDEAHAIRNRKIIRSKTAFALKANHRLALTGHPYSQSPDELYSILHFLWPDLYSSFWRFFGMHVNAAPKTFGGFDVLGVRRPKLLRWEIAPFSLRRTKRKVFPSLPPITRIPREVELTKKGAAEYQRLRKQIFAELETEEGTKRLPILNVLSRTTRIRQYLVDPGLLGAKESSVKYAEVHRLIESLDGPPVIFTSFREAAIRLSAYLKKRHRSSAMIHGEVKGAARERAKHVFLRGDVDSLIVVTQAGSEALNLGKYGYVIFLDLPWTARAIEQAEGRVDRPEEGTGRLVPTTVYRIVVRGTYEDRIEQKINEQYSMFSDVFTTDGLKELFR